MNGGRSAFRVLCGLAALAALALIGSNVAVILLRGAKSLPEALTQPETLFALGTSLKTASISTVLCFVLAVPTAYLLTRTEFPGRAAVEMLLELTMSLPYIVLGVSLLILFSSPAGKALKAAGLPVVFSQNGIVLAQLTVNLPFAVQLASTAFRRADRKLEYVAGLLGAGEARRFFYHSAPPVSSQSGRGAGAGLVPGAGGIRRDPDAGGRDPDEDRDAARKHLSECECQRSGWCAGQRVPAAGHLGGVAGGGLPFYPCGQKVGALCVNRYCS